MSPPHDFISTPAVPLDGPQWRYVLAIYALPGVSSACLMLQDRLGLDVLVMLHLAYAATRCGVAVSEETITAADALVGQWRTDVVRPLRAARHAIPRHQPAVADLRAKVQQAELLAEQHALAWLAASLPPGSSPPPASAVLSIRGVAAFYAARQVDAAKALEEPEVLAAIERLQQALD